MFMFLNKNTLHPTCASNPCWKSHPRSLNANASGKRPNTCVEHTQDILRPLGSLPVIKRRSVGWLTRERRIRRRTSNFGQNFYESDLRSFVIGSLPNMQQSFYIGPCFDVESHPLLGCSYAAFVDGIIEIVRGSVNSSGHCREIKRGHSRGFLGLLRFGARLSVSV